MRSVSDDVPIVEKLETDHEYDADDTEYRLSEKITSRYRPGVTRHGYAIERKQPDPEDEQGGRNQEPICLEKPFDHTKVTSQKSKVYAVKSL